ncbi:MAG: sulfite exporter TauE/SafE family protein [Myxococcota bacterium]
MNIDFYSINFILLIILIFLGGFVDSIAGGGGIITLPAYFAFGIPPYIALGTNKFSGFFGTLFASIKYLRNNAVNIRIAIIATISSIIGSAIGSKVATLMSEEIIHYVVLIITPSVLIFFLLKDVVIPNRKIKRTIEKSIRTDIYSAITGLLIGFYDGFFGPGTGTFLTIAFNSLIGLELIIASGTARLCNLGSNFGSLVIFLSNNKVLFPLAIFTAVSGIAGNILGSTIALEKKEKIIKPLLSLTMILLIFEILRKRFF